MTTQLDADREVRTMVERGFIYARGVSGEAALDELAHYRATNPTSCSVLGPPLYNDENGRRGIWIMVFD